MKNFLNLFLLCSAIIVSSKNICAQSAIRIYDLSTGAETDSTSSQARKTKLYVNFKLDKVEQADSVFFKFGNKPGGAESLTESGQFVKQGSNYVVKTQGPTYPIRNSEASCRVKINSAQFKSAKYLSLVVKDKSGLFTNVLHLRIN